MIVMIPKASCKDRVLYRIFSRNLRLGVFIEKTGGFIGLRQKFSDIYPFVEYHRENAAFGTVNPKEELPERLPDEIQNLETLGSFCSKCGEKCTYIPAESKWIHTVDIECYKITPCSRFNKPLFEWLQAMAIKYPAMQS